MSVTRSLLRASGERSATVGNAELFFDLVYVFAVTQLSHYVLNHAGPIGAAQAAVLFGAVWWAWVYTIWATNWLDPERFVVRVMIFAMMLVSLVMSVTIPKAFGAGGLAFALAYSGSQIARSLFVVAALRRERPRGALNMTKATIWFAATCPLWLGGALAGPELRLILWAVAVAIDLAAPLALFWVPGLGRADTRDFEISGHHMAERCGLFIIVALGEGIVVTGATAAGLPPTAANLAAFVTAFLGSVAMWWLYFDRGAEAGSEHITHAADSGRIARGAYSWLHLPIVGGIIVAAVGDEWLLAHPDGHTDLAFTLAAVGGPALFLAGCMVFKRGFTGFHPLSHLAGLAGFALIALAALLLQPARLAIGLASTFALFAVAVWEWRSFHGGWTKAARPGTRRATARSDR